MLLCSAVKKYSRLGWSTLPCPQGGGGGSARRNILLLTLVANNRVQGTAHAGTTSGVLRRSSRSAVCEPVCYLPSAIFHNTQPSWSLAQPFRFAAHNGEINTISG